MNRKSNKSEFILWLSRVRIDIFLRIFDDFLDILRPLIGPDKTYVPVFGLMLRAKKAE